MTCEHCEAAPAKHTRFANLTLCAKCEQDLVDLEQQRITEEREEIKKLVEGNKWEPSLAYMLCFKKIAYLQSDVVSIVKIPDVINTHILPLVHLMSTADIERLFPIVKEFYFALKSAVGMRQVDREHEAIAIKMHQARTKTRAKAEKEITKQKKFASRDHTLSKEERARAKVLEGLTATFGGDEKAALEMMEKLLKGKK